MIDKTEKIIPTETPSKISAAAGVVARIAVAPLNASIAIGVIVAGVFAGLMDAAKFFFSKVSGIAVSDNPKPFRDKAFDLAIGCITEGTAATLGKALDSETLQGMDTGLPTAEHVSGIFETHAAFSEEDSHVAAANTRKSKQQRDSGYTPV